LPSKFAVKEIGSGLLVILLVAVGCATKPRVMTDFDDSVDFSAYQRFAWFDEPTLLVAPMAEPLNPLLEGRIKSSFETKMAARGIERAEAAADADLLVRFTIGARDALRIDSFDYGTWCTGPAYGHASCRGGREVRARSYTEGQLAIDLFDAKSGAPVWHGTSTDTIRRSDRENQQSMVDRMVDAIMSRYPPR